MPQFYHYINQHRMGNYRVHKQIFKIFHPISENFQIDLLQVPSGILKNYLCWLPYYSGLYVEKVYNKLKISQQQGSNGKYDFVLLSSKAHEGWSKKA